MVALIELETLHSSPADESPSNLAKAGFDIGAQRDLEGSQIALHLTTWYCHRYGSHCLGCRFREH
jgi:hypothetical protein